MGRRSFINLHEKLGNFSPSIFHLLALVAILYEIYLFNVHEKPEYRIENKKPSKFYFLLCSQMENDEIILSCTRERRYLSEQILLSSLDAPFLLSNFPEVSQCSRNL